jgi:hypothetical protein
MDIKKEVVETLKNALLNCSSKYSIPELSVGIMIFTENEKGKMTYKLLSRRDVVKILDLKADVLNSGKSGIMGSFEANFKAPLIESYMKKIILNLAQKEKFSTTETNVRIFFKKDGALSYYLFKGEQGVKELVIDEILQLT